ncbi:related to peroxisomal membrane protein PMP47B [Cephalotrichum gorgonifer]|uniref:Related to peroxisomal membrane protein PMP47B n=1 Tax=Cephalotrichum gorgonifer TaxID=2041049 RepID=A0AAE8MZC6_9PEZI|nr:related to peroxisomal membrane protein PMP47B [Cephalotrichum gorgonifer]
MSSKSPIPQNDNVAHALAGAGGGILSMALTYPLITLSTRAQVESKRADTNFIAAVERIIAREGVQGLYAGIDSALFGISVTNFVYYYWYEWTRAFFESAASRTGRAAKKLTTVESMIAGALAGSATVILTNPIWVVNTRMTTKKQRSVQEKAAAKKVGDEEAGVKEGEAEAAAAAAPVAGPAPPAGTIATVLAMLRSEGPQAFFSGVVPALVLVVNPILQYTLFEQLKNYVERRRKVTPGIAFFLGALGKLFATSVTYPYITVKSRMHVSGNDKEGVTGAIRRVIREEGYAGLYNGIGPKVTQSVLTAAFLFAFKDVLYAQMVRLRLAAAKKALKA